MGAAVLLSVVGSFGVMALALVTMAIRHAQRPASWDVVDAWLALVVLFLSTAGATTAVLWRPGASMSVFQEPSLGAVVLGTGAGELLTAFVCLVIAGSAALGFRRPALQDVVVGAGLALPILGVYEFWSRVSEMLGWSVDEQRLVQLLQSTPQPLDLVVPVLFTVLGAPLCEEVVFRGFLIPPLQRRFGPSVAVVVSALLFGLAHAGDGSSVVPLIALGALLGTLRVRFGTLWPSLALHVSNNAIALVLTLAG